MPTLPHMTRANFHGVRPTVDSGALHFVQTGAGLRRGAQACPMGLAHRGVRRLEVLARRRGVGRSSLHDFGQLIMVLPSLFHGGVMRLLRRFA